MVAATRTEDEVNEVILRGRVSSEPQERVLPSGDTLVTFRVVVSRPPQTRGRSKVTVDTFDCAAWTVRMHRAARKLSVQDVVEVRGRLRRRFQRVGGAATSLVDVELTSCRRVA